MLTPCIVYALPSAVLYPPAFVEGSEAITPRSSKIKLSPALVQFSEDMQLAWTRRLLMERAGFTVRTLAPREIQVFDREIEPVPMAALFCHTVAAADAAMLAQHLQSRVHSIRLIRLTSTWKQERAVYDKMLQAPIPPENLLWEFIRLREST